VGRSFAWTSAYQPPRLGCWCGASAYSSSSSSPVRRPELRQVPPRASTPSVWGRSENYGTKSPRTSGVRRRTPASVFAAIIVAPRLRLYSLRGRCLLPELPLVVVLHMSRMRLEIHVWGRPCGSRASGCSLHGPAAQMGVRTHGGPSVSGPELASRAAETPNSPPVGQQLLQGASEGADRASFPLGSLVRGWPEGVRLMW
jgi:hypothetical protein